MIAEESAYHRPFLDLWFSVPYRYPAAPDPSSLSCTLCTLLAPVRSAFFSARAADFLTRGTLPVAVEIAGRTYLHLVGDNPPRFRTLIRRTDDPCQYEFLILPRDRYSLHDLATDRKALLAVNRLLSSGTPAPLSYAGFDEEGEPVGRTSFGALSMRYLMRDRIRAAVSDLFFDKFCFFETVFESVRCLQAGGAGEYTAAWIAKVDAILEEELARQQIDRAVLEKRKRSLNSFIQSVRRRTTLPQMR
ncbi:hypothetical protein [uncultured Methanofollis sp.]|uniref:hypothetical protein n=1 Tax=uncultured Methanofollis sp. TaxID=262500 RepID=UPI0026216805|nr:hypothetical protein [uncultured Methanofollis sp.]